MWPLVNDVATDLDDPPQYLDRDPRPLRRLEVVRREVRDLAPLELALEVAAAYALALEVARRLGWKVTGEDPERAVFQAEAATRLLRFVDDVAVRVRPAGTVGGESAGGAGGGARVDVRSRSRVGRRDLGTNERRIRQYLAALRAAALDG